MEIASFEVSTMKPHDIFEDETTEEWEKLRYVCHKVKKKIFDRI